MNAVGKLIELLDCSLAADCTDQIMRLIPDFCTHGAYFERNNSVHLGDDDDGDGFGGASCGLQLVLESEILPLMMSGVTLKDACWPPVSLCPFGVVSTRYLVSLAADNEKTWFNFCVSQLDLIIKHEPCEGYRRRRRGEEGQLC